jgi:hypothetical protein
VDLLSIGMAVAVAAAVLGVRWVALGGRDRVRDVLLRSAADRHGGSVEPVAAGLGQELVIPLDEPFEELRVRFVHATGAAEQRQMRAKLIIRRVLPRFWIRPQGSLAEVATALGRQDILVGHPDLDRRFVIAGDEPARIEELFDLPVARAVLGLSLWHGAQVWAELSPDLLSAHSVLEVRCTGWLDSHEQLRSLIEAVEQLGAELARSWDAPWLEAAHARGLAVGKLGKRGTSTLVGVIDGVPVEARARRGPQGWRTEVSAWVDVLPGLRIVHRDTAREEGWDGDRVPLGNPVLDMLVAARVQEPQALRDMLADEALVEALLAVVHGRPGSALQHDSVRLVAPDRLTAELPEALDDVLELARMLGARVEAG